MEIKASLQNLRTSARKVRLVADLVRTLKTDKAIAQLKFANKDAALPLIKLIESAIANAVNNYGAQADNLFIKTIRVDEGRTLKRWMPKAHGRATSIRKRSCHVEVILGEIKDSGVRKAKKSEIEAPVKLGDLATQSEATKKKISAKAKTSKSKETAEKETVESAPEARPSKAKADKSASKGFTKRMFNRKAG
jgi:large subunit ribosomal protein L22